jgi:hypothetical protein
MVHDLSAIASILPELQFVEIYVHGSRIPEHKSGALDLELRKVVHYDQAYFKHYATNQFESHRPVFGIKVNATRPDTPGFNVRDLLIVRMAKKERSPRTSNN